jgi:hypothetical protein
MDGQVAIPLDELTVDSAEFDISQPALNLG